MDVELTKDGKPKKKAGRPRKSTNTKLNNDYQNKYNGQPIDETVIAISELRGGLRRAIKRKYGSTSKWFNQIMHLAENNPYMTKVLLELMYTDKPVKNVASKQQEQPQPKTTGDNVIRLGFTTETDTEAV